MKPEPWGEALDALSPAGERRRRSSCPTPSGEPFTQALAARAGRRASTWCSPAAATRASTSGCSTTPATRMRGPRGLARRLRAQRRRGGRAGDHRGGRAAAARASWATRSRWPRSRTSDGLLEYPVYTKPASWRGHDVPQVLLSGDHAADRRLAARPGRTPHRRAPPRPAPTPRARSTSATPTSRCALAQPGRRRRAAHPAAGLLGAGAAGQPGRRHPGAARGPRRRRGLARRVDHARACAAAAGWSAPCAAGSTGDGRWDIGRLMVAPDLQGRGLGPAAARRASRRPRRPRRRRTCCSPAPAASATMRMYKKAGYRLPASRARARRGAVRPDQAPRRPSSISGVRPLWQTCPSVQSAKGPLRGPSGGSPRRLLPQGEHDAAGQHDGPHQLHASTDSAADLWHSRGDDMTNVIDRARQRHQARRRPRLPRRRHRQGPRQGRRGQPLPRPGLPGRRDPRPGLRHRPHLHRPQGLLRRRCRAHLPAHTRRSSSRSRSSPAVTSAARSSTTCATCAARPPRSRSAARPEPTVSADPLVRLCA